LVGRLFLSFSCALTSSNSLTQRIGFRYIFEALAGGDLSNIGPNWFCVGPTGESAFIDTSLKKLELSSLTKTLAAKSRVLVGHNLFTDLIFLYHTFIGNLPPTVTEFQQKIHALFPMVIDTKYMATRKTLIDSRQSSSLQDLHQVLKSQRIPQICLPEEFRSYQNRHLLHEAGYDSYLTAQIFLKLAAKLDVSVPNHNDATHAVDPVELSTVSADSTSSDDDGGGVLLNPPPDAPHSANRFQILSELSPVKKKARQASLLDSDIEDDMTGSPPLGQDGTASVLANAARGNNFVPPLTAPFWRVYANKLRVYGTMDEVCELDGGGAGELAHLN
jgi:poly(A)-specific ribonuclease